MRLRRLSWVALAAALLVNCQGRPRAVKQSSEPSYGGDGQLVVFDFTSGVPEAPGQGGFLPTPASATFAGLLQKLKKASQNKKAKGTLIRFGSQAFDWAQTEELSRLFLALRQGDKPVFCHADDLGNISYWLAAAACDEIWLSPAGSVDGVGIAGQALYLKGLLDSLKVKAEFLRMGRYKSAAETLTRDGPSEAAKESMLSVLRSIRAAWLDGLAAAKPESDVRNSMEHGPWDPDGAEKAGLVDHVGYESEARKALKKKAQSDQFVTPSGEQEENKKSASGIAKLIHFLAGAEATEAPHIVVLAAEGSIAMSGGGAFSSDEGIAAPSFIKQVRRLKDDESVKAVVLRLNSPGGSALASDLMWHELMELREAKPVIASVGGMAASGGYFMAVASHRILAEKTSIVGSIGVVGGKIMLADALAEFGINTHTFAASEEEGAAARAAYLSPFVEWNDETRAKVQSQMANIYELFLDRVSKGRGMPVDDIRKIAEGRIWSGAQGKDNGLVDELGGLQRAIEVALEKAGLPADAPVVIQGGGGSWLEKLGLGEDSDEATVAAAAAKWQASRPGASSWLPQAAWSGLTTAQKHHIESLSPLLTGESVILALPFAFSAQ